MSKYDYDIEHEVLIADIRAQGQYENTLLLHSNCSDPDHPGCVECEEEE